MTEVQDQKAPAVREIPEGSGINGRPILDDGTLLRHLAYHQAGTAGVWGWTWCGEYISSDHQCPLNNDGERIKGRYQRPVGNCEDCHALYQAGIKGHRKLPDSV